MEARTPPGATARALAALTIALTAVAGALVFSEAIRPIALATGLLAPPPIRAEHVDLRALDPGRGPARPTVDEPPRRAPRPALPLPHEAAPEPATAERLAPAPHGTQQRAHAKLDASVRLRPAPDAEELGKLKAGEAVLVLERKGGFALVLATGPDGVNMGWVDEKGLGP